MTAGPTNREYASLARRLAALFYDALIVVALWMLTGAIVLAFTGGEAVPAGTIWFRCLLLAVPIVFFTSFWIHGGQTLGMQAWRIKLVDEHGSPPDWRTAGIRFAAGCLSLAACGIGFLWALFDEQRRTWHDKVAGTRLVLLPKRRRRRG
jgi:uncharacterized RDD family membrane protein YckC